MTWALSQTDRITGPSGLDLCPYLIAIYTRTWWGGIRGDGSYSDSILQLPPWSKIRKVHEREIAQSGGRYRTGDVMIWHLRPRYTDPVTNAVGGFTEQQLDPPILNDGVEVFYRLTAQHPNATGEAGDYTLVELDRSSPLHFNVVIRRRTTPASDPQPDET